MALNGVKIIPNVNILPEYCWDWCFDGLPQESLIACSTIGRMQNKESTKDIEIINFKSRGQKVRENFGN